MSKLFVSICAAGALTLSAADKPTFTETIAPIVYGNCTTCHRPGQAAPFSLITYEDVKKRGSLIATVTQSRYMPPWHAEHGYGEFADERRLTDDQISAIASWVKQGMPEGDPKKLPTVPQFPEGWHLGKPDLILEMSAAFDLPASGPDIYRNFVVPTGLTQDKWVRAIEFHPSARKAVHHTLFAYDATGASARMDGRDGKPGFTGMSAVGVTGAASNRGARAGDLVGVANAASKWRREIWKPGRLGRGSNAGVSARGHCTPASQRVRHHSSDAFSFDRQGGVGALHSRDLLRRKSRRKGWYKRFRSRRAIRDRIWHQTSKFPGDSSFTVEDSITLPVDVKAFSVGGHAHYLCKEMKATATLPDGSIQPLLWIKDWDFNWQDRYTYQSPILLPHGYANRREASVRQLDGQPA